MSQPVEQIKILEGLEKVRIVTSRYIGNKVTGRGTRQTLCAYMDTPQVMQRIRRIIIEKAYEALLGGIVWGFVTSEAGYISTEISMLTSISMGVWIAMLEKNAIQQLKEGLKEAVDGAIRYLLIRSNQCYQAIYTHLLGSRIWHPCVDVPARRRLKDYCMVKQLNTIW